MKEIKKNSKKMRIITILLAALMSITMLIFVPQISKPVFADEGDPALVLGAGALSKDANGEKPQVLTYGGQDWYVIAYDGKNGYGEYISYINAQGFEEALYRENTVTLLQKTIDTEIAFRKDSQAVDANEYGKSELPAYYKARLEDENKPLFSAQEQSAIAARTLAGGNANYNMEGYDTNRVKGENVKDAVLWPLSVAEASALSNTIRTNGNEQFWWLRTPGEDDRSSAGVWAGGDINEDGNRVTNPSGIRSAFDLTRICVLFTSAAEDGKASASAGTDALTPVRQNKSNRWKVTLKDDGTIAGLDKHKSFVLTSTKTTCDGKSLNIGYRGATTGANEYISAIIVNYEGAITYYGRLGFASADADASVTINLGDALGEGDKLYLFNEQYNGDNKTDYASALKEVVIPQTGHDWEFTGFSWEGDESAGFTGAEATYVCKNDPEHTTSVAAEFNTIIVDPTCTEEGQTTFIAAVYADYSPDGQDHSESKESEPAAPLGHDWAFIDFVWNGDDYSGYTEAAAYYVCRHDENHTQTVAAKITEESTEPTCADMGMTSYTAVVAAADSPDGEEHSAKADAKYIEPLGHDWEFVDFTWNGSETEGFTEVTANYKCKKDESHTTSVYVGVIVEETPPACTESGKTVYTAVITAGESPDMQDHSEVREAKTSEPTGHDWEFVNFSWTGEESTGFTKVIAGFRCRNNPMHTKAADASFTEEVIEPTCTEGGKTVYTATVTAADSLDNSEHTGTKDAKITPAKGHIWEFDKITWTGDAVNGYTKAAITYRCKTDQAHTYSIDIAVTEKVTEATCTTDGKTTYSTTIAAPVSLDKQEHSATTDGKTVKAKGHDWAFIEFVWTGDDVNGYTGAKAYYQCKTDPSHTQMVAANITETVIEPTAASEGKTIYTALVTKNISLDKIEHSSSKDAKAIGSITYTISANDDTTWAKGSSSTLDFTVNRNVDDSQTYGQFREILVDGSPIASSHYTVTAGSLHVSIKSSYLKTLEEGPHTLTVVFGDATSSNITFTVAPKGSKTVPKGNGNSSVGWLILITIAIMVIAIGAVFLWRKLVKKQ